MKNLKENLPVISIIALATGMTRLIVYYQFFGINITTFIDTSEIFQLSAPFFLFLSVYTFYVSPILIRKLPSEINKKRLRRLQIKQSKMRLRTRFVNYFFDKRISPKYIIISLILAALSQLSLYLGFEIFSAITITIFCLLIVYFISEFVVIQFEMKNMLSKNEPFFPEDSALSILDIPLFFMALIAISIEEAVLTKYHVSQYECVIKLEDTTVASSTNYIYIGKTKEYVFFYDKSKSGCDVFSKSDIKKFSYKKKYNY